MQWIVDNWLVLLLGGGMVAMHLFGHGHGSHGGHGRGDRTRVSTDEKAGLEQEPRDARAIADDDNSQAQTGPSDDTRT